jgi:hypothetical protein
MHRSHTCRLLHVESSSSSQMVRLWSDPFAVPMRVGCSYLTSSILASPAEKVTPRSNCDPTLGKPARTRHIEVYLTRRLLLKSRGPSLL